MDDRYSVEWTPDLEYIGVRIPDKMTIAALINDAKGNRTMAQLAEACDVSASTLSRAVNGKITKPMTIELISAIADHAEPKDPRLFEKLVRANGLMPKEIYEARSRSGPSSRMEERRNLETKAQNIIMTELLNRGIPVKLVDQNEAMVNSSCGQTLPFDFAIQTDIGQGTFIWSFMVIPYFLDEMVDGRMLSLRLFQRRIMQNMSGWFIEDAWEPEKLKRHLHTFLFIDPSVYLHFEDTVVVGAKVNNDFSMVTLDMETEKVNFEIYLSRRDEAEHELIFARKVIETNEGADASWEIGVHDFTMGEDTE